MKTLNLKISLLAAICLLFSVGPARAWNCPSGQIRQQAPSGTPTNTPSYDVVEGIAFICVPTNPPNPTPTTTQQNQQQNQSQTVNNRVTSSSQGGNATGGNVSGSGNSTNTLANKIQNSGNSTLKNSGNSSNVNTNSTSATGGQQSQTASSAATNNGNGANNSNYESNTTVKAAAATAFAQASPTVSCFKGIGVGGQLVGGGLSFSGGKIDANCAILETARSLANFGSDESYCKVMLTDKYVKAAGVTMQDCLRTRKPIPVPVLIPAPVEPAQPTIIIVPEQPAPAPVPVINTVTRLTDVGTCKLHQWNACLRILDMAVLKMEMNTDAKLVLTGSQESSKAVVYLRGKIDPSRIDMHFADEQNSTLDIQLFAVVE